MVSKKQPKNWPTVEALQQAVLKKKKAANFHLHKEQVVRLMVCENSAWEVALGSSEFDLHSGCIVKATITAKSNTVDVARTLLREVKQAYVLRQGGTDAAVQGDDQKVSEQECQDVDKGREESETSSSDSVGNAATGSQEKEEEEEVIQLHSFDEAVNGVHESRCSCDDFAEGPCPAHPNPDDPYPHFDSTDPWGEPT
jgi:hypothetical protein